jgi:AcrR family transcriptional regulator
VSQASQSPIGARASGSAQQRPPRRRQPRRDAEANRERLLAAAASAMMRAGRGVPLATIAAQAGVGVGTLYRKYADRDALLQALEYRAYGLLNQILDQIEPRELSGLDAVGEFLRRCLEVGDQLVLPLHGAPPLVTDEAVAARQAINRRLDLFTERGRADGSINAPINATDIIVFSAIITQPRIHGPNWPHLIRRQLATHLAGLAAKPPADLPRPPVTSHDMENAFTPPPGDTRP